MSSPLASELTELAAPRPGFRLSAPHALAAPGAAAHARGRGCARHAGGAEALELLSRLQSGGKKEGCPPAQAHGRALSRTLRGPFCLSMASHQQSRIQAYLEKNKIGPLFEVRRCGGGRSRLYLGEGVQNTRREGGTANKCAGGVAVRPQFAGIRSARARGSGNAAGRAPCRLPGRGQVSWRGPSVSLAGEV